MSSNSLLVLDPTVIPALDVSGPAIEVGILPDGTPFMSGRELARACGISNSTLVNWGEVTPQVGDRYRAGKLAELLTTYRYQGDRLFVRIPEGTQYGGRANVSAYPYQVCMAFLDYYAFEANKAEARNSLRLLSEKQLPQCIYEAVDHASTPSSQCQPDTSINPVFKRPLRNGVPIGYFSVEQSLPNAVKRSLPTAKLTHLSTSLLRNIDKAWSRYWTIQRLSQEYGDRVCLPQPTSRDWSSPRQYVYPKKATAEFQHWLSWEYLPGDRFPSYQQRQRYQCSGIGAYLEQLPQLSFDRLPESTENSNIQIVSRHRDIRSA